MKQKKQTKPDLWNKNALLVFLFIGLILRVLPVFWGIPLKPYIRSYHPDEAKVLNSILSFPEIYWTTKPFAGYGTAVQYILGTFLLPFKWFFLKSLNLGYEYFIIASIFSRFASVTFGTGCILLTYLTAKKIYDEKVALLSAAFLSVAFFHTLNSALITLDVSSSFILMLNFFLCFKAIESNRWRDYIILGIASGILVGTKTVLGIFFCIPFLLNFLKLYTPALVFIASLYNRYFTHPVYFCGSRMHILLQ
ncbi:MAG: glycosyltransferase family 39 protein [Desulfosalsimonadaceae bacterium]